MKRNQARFFQQGTSACFLCHSLGKIIYPSLTDKLTPIKGHFSYRQCLSCGLMWIDPMPKSQILTRHYRNYYTHNRCLSAITVHRSFVGWRNRLRQAILCGYFGYRDISHNHGAVCLLGFLLGQYPSVRNKASYNLKTFLPQASFRKTGLVIDVGCGTGQYLKRMKNFGWNVLGIEQDWVSARQAKESGLEVLEKSLYEVDLRDAQADLVVMNHSFEHLPDPVTALRICHQALRLKGRLVIRMPNIESLGHKKFQDNWLGLDAPRHLFLYSPKSAGLLMQRSLFTSYRLKTIMDHAADMYSVSVLIREEGKISFNRSLRPRSLRKFLWQERLLNLFGGRFGEELEIVAVKS